MNPTDPLDALMTAVYAEQPGLAARPAVAPAAPQGEMIAAPRVSPPLEGTDSAKDAIARVKYSHDAIIDAILVNPGLSQGALAKHFGYTQAWISRVMNSDAFLARLAQRKSDIIDPSLVLSIDERLRAVATRSLDIVLEKLENPSVSLPQALEVVAVTSKALGYGARQSNLTFQQNFVVAMPGKAPSESDWASRYSGPSPQLRAMAAEAGGGVVDAQIREIPATGAGV